MTKAGKASGAKAGAGGRANVVPAPARTRPPGTRPPIKDSPIAGLLQGNAIENHSQQDWTVFLQTLAETANVTAAAERAGIHRITCYARKRQDAKFSELWEQARDIGFSVLECEAKRRAYDGYDEPVFYQGEQVATVRKFSDALLMFLLQGNDKRYARKQEITGAGGSPLIAMFASMSKDDLDDHIANLQRQLGELPPVEDDA